MTDRSRRRTPDVRNPDGMVTVTIQRCCNGCGEPLGDATMTEIELATDGKPLPDVRLECPRCSPEMNPPVADPEVPRA